MDLLLGVNRTRADDARARDARRGAGRAGRRSRSRCATAASVPDRTTVRLGAAGAVAP